MSSDFSVVVALDWKSDFLALKLGPFPCFLMLLTPVCELLGQEHVRSAAVTPVPSVSPEKHLVT